MRIGHFVSFGVGGADKNSENIVKGLVELGQDVIVFYNDYSFPKVSTQYDSDTVMVSRFDNYKNVKMIKINNVSEFNNYNIDVLNTHRSGEDFWLLNGFESTNFNFKVVETNFHGITKTKADIRIYPSNTMIKERHLPHVVIPNAISTPETNENLRDELNIVDKFVYGRLSPARMEIYSTVNLESYKRIESDNTCFLYVSPCKQARVDAKNMDIKNIIFIDELIDGLTISKLYNTFDVFCHSNLLGETFGMTIAEAMMHSKPVISHIGQRSWSQAQPEVIGELSNELFVQDDIVNNYHKLMLKLKDDKEYYNRCSSILKNRADNVFNYVKVAEKYLDVYKKITNK